MKIKDFKVNEMYSNNDIREAFQCALMGGMRRSHVTNTLVLVSNHTGDSIYGDKWIDGLLHYTGMGKKGDQSLNGNQNITLAKSNTIPEITVYLFEVFEKTKYTYAGIVKLVGDTYQTLEEDEDKKVRKVFRFPLQVMNEVYYPVKDTVEQADKKLKKKLDNLSAQQIEMIAKRKSYDNKRKSKRRKVITNHYERDPFIAKYVKNLANGICQLCYEYAPFKDSKGTPYLQSHHIEYLSEGGEDTIENCISLCPNCHARIHSLKLEADKIKLIKIVQSR